MSLQDRFSVIDFHMHAFPDRIAGRTIEGLAARCKTRPMTDGTSAGLLQYLDDHHFKAGVLLQIATRPKQQTNVNNWAAELQRAHTNLYGFGSIHPEAPDWEEELERIRTLGLKGIKLHPDYQDFYTDEERLRPVYRKLAELGLPVLFHGGVDPLCPDDVHNPPKAMAKVLEWEPTLRVIDAHLGDMIHYQETLNYLVGKNLYLDLSMALNFWPREALLELFEKHGCDHLLFGTDCPWGNPEENLNVLESLGLSDADLKKILSENAERILEI